MQEFFVGNYGNPLFLFLVSRANFFMEDRLGIIRKIADNGIHLQRDQYEMHKTISAVKAWIIEGSLVIRNHERASNLYYTPCLLALQTRSMVVAIYVIIVS